MEKPDVPFSSVRGKKAEELEKIVKDYIKRFLLTIMEIDDKLKERSNWGTTYFDAETNRNSSNFSAKAGGSGEFEGLYNKYFAGLTTEAIFWTSNSYDNLNAYVRILNWASSEFASNLRAKTTQRSIRCLKD
jgi:uncharacterized protein (TIGR02145 family)